METDRSHPLERTAEFQDLGLASILAKIIALGKERATGCLEIRDRQLVSLCLYLELGRLTWATGGMHPQRRWRRQYALACHGGDLRKDYPAQDALRLRDSFIAWDYHLAIALHKRQRLTVEQVRVIASGMTAELLFDLHQLGSPPQSAEPAEGAPAKTLQLAWMPGRRPSRDLTIPSSWVSPLNEALTQASQAWQAWLQADLGRYSPDLAPKILNPAGLQAHVAPNTYKNLQGLLNGKRTLRDLAAIMGLELLKVTRPLAPYVQGGLIAFLPGQDLPPKEAPSDGQAPSDAAARRLQDRAPLVVCIDDSLQSCQLAEKLLNQAGYRSSSIQNPIDALSILAERKPDLILLDLVMPNVSGYELCSQIRRISTLKETPVVIVTGNDGFVDRVRAKLAGASDFVSKPFPRERLLELLRKHLPDRLDDANAR